MNPKPWQIINGQTEKSLSEPVYAACDLLKMCIFHHTFPFPPLEMFLFCFVFCCCCCFTILTPFREMRVATQREVWNPTLPPGVQHGFRTRDFCFQSPTLYQLSYLAPRDFDLITESTRFVALYYEVPSIDVLGR